MSTQWRENDKGLDYTPIFARMAQMRLSHEEHEALFQDMRHLEREALRLIHPE